MAANNDKDSRWRVWREFFEQRRNRALPSLNPRVDYGMLPRSLARSLAVFQLGESGGGTIIEQARRSRLPEVDAEYTQAVEFFVEEEHRHANILAMCVRLMHGELIQTNWTARLFVLGRRLIGLRLKVLVLLAAEVVGICYYAAIAERIPPGRMQRWLLELVDDERAHLDFHCAFLKAHTHGAWKQRLFMVTWRTVIWAAAITVMIDHREMLRDLQIAPRALWRRWMNIAAQAEALVLENADAAEPADAAVIST